MEVALTDDKNALRAASELARAGNVGEAIACLEAALARTRPSASRPVNTAILAKTAAVFCEQDGDLLRAATYYDEAIAAEGPQPLILVALADIYSRLGRFNDAWAGLARAEALARSAGDDDALKVVAACRARLEGPGE
jgi:tetratricopeptide (TPR) repeat protein